MAEGESATRDFIDKHTYKLLAGAALGAVAIATVVYRLVEEWSWVDSLYFSIVAITTVGFGDITPTSDASKLFTVFYIVSGITIFATYLNARMRVHAHKGQQRRQG